MTDAWIKEFWSRAAIWPATNCWLWQRGKTGLGYGVITIKDKIKMAHRIAYELRYGSVPEGLDLDHLCRNRSCINPDHLEAVTHRENCLRGISPWALNAAKTKCSRGHAYASEIKPRRCKICQAERDDIKYRSNHPCIMRRKRHRTK